MTEHWVSYFCNVNGKLASIFLDIDLRNIAPDSGRPWLLWLWIYFKRPRPDGLSSSEEFPTLCLIEDKVNNAIGQNCQALRAGRITTDGRREFYYYGPNSSRFGPTIADLMKSFPGYEFDHGSRHDPAWDQYLNVLFPSDDDLQKILNREVLDVMENQGDQPEIPREVLHWAYFPTEVNRSDFEAAVQTKEYRIGSKSHHPEGENPYGVCFGKAQKCTSDAIDKGVLELRKLVERFQGEYDGWEAQVMPDAEEPSCKPT
jgi:regulator of RNase E activity RraB